MAETAFVKGSWTAIKAQTTFESMLNIGNTLCAMCGLNLATMEDISANNTELPPPKLSECLNLVCGSCNTEETDTVSIPTSTATPTPTPKCRGYKVSYAHTKPPSTASSPSKNLPQISARDTPTKVLALLTSLKTFRVGGKAICLRKSRFVFNHLTSSSIVYLMEPQ
ncbi:hypothetical protein DL95DRAFT_416224 [Leptodontidium sp. 2 PMI_412]|nr:hypothetical protein DL95DRAFT_416224 [Leptodontidium sp. 2 PMI_412]